ncbi:MAG TPA: extracellular solute-binding protein [Pseudolabrys sp.]|jgi:iron(III) transport system substrate-binding protein|nr:extracellular solute-binding protein [Pseudolabrys sp.]
MNLSRRGFVTATLATMYFGPSFSATAEQSPLAQKAKSEGELTWYVGSIDAHTAQSAGHAFTAKYGVKVNVVRAASQIVFRRLMQDLGQGAANADVFSSVDIAHFIDLKSKSALAHYRPENAAEVLPQFQNLDPDGYFYATVASVIALGYNTKKVQADAAPKSWTDLLDAKWTDKIALGHPAYSGFAGSWAAQMFKLYGKSYFEKLAKLQPLVSRSLLDATTLLTSGERWLTASPIAPLMVSADKGNPIAIIYPSDGSILVSTPSGVMKNAPHPNAARLFMEFLLGPEFSRILVKARYETMRADVKPLPGVKSVADLKVIQPTAEDQIKGIPAVAELWRDTFGQ